MNHASKLSVPILCLGLLSGCASDAPPIPPTPLAAIDSQVSADRRWAVDIGKTDKLGSTRMRMAITSACIWTANINGLVQCVSPDGGKVRHRFELSRSLLSGVAADEQRLLVSDRDGTVLALSAETGEVIWEYALGSEVLAPAAMTSSVAVVRGSNGRLVALDLDSGEERWSYGWTPPALTVRGYEAPTIINDDGLLAGLDDGRVVALQADTGQVIWDTPASWPSGKSEVERLVDLDSTILVDDEYIYAVNYQGRLVKLHPAQGQTVWGVEFSSLAGMAQTRDALLVVLDNDDIVAVDKASGVQRWRQSALQHRHLTSPVIRGDHLLVGDIEGYLHWVNVADGRLTGRRQLGDSRVVSVGVFAEGPRVLAMTRDARLYRVDWAESDH